MKGMKSILFIIWVVVITTLSVIPYSEKGSVSFKLTESRMFLHFAAYFVGAALFYWAFRKNAVFSILFSIFTIFLYSVVLEIVQLYLPYRTFNPIDIAANGFGIIFFSLVWAILKRNRKEEIVISG